MATVTRTMNPLPFGDLEPKRFEDLIRQLAYDFRPWRRLEATGRAGSDDGFDARGYECHAPADDLPPHNDMVEETEQEPAAAQSDRLWLIQCKREKRIGPKQLRAHLDEIVLSGDAPLYGIVFATACDVSLATRDVLAAWCRANALAEWHIWGRSELEDMLFQPKNDNLLFAYFGISLTMRRRTAASSKRHEIAVKRKLRSVLGGSGRGRVLLRDIDDTDYPYEPKNGEARRWRLVEVSELGAEGIWISLGRAPGWLSPDATQWDAALAAFDDDLAMHDPWAELSPEHMRLQQQASEAMNAFPPEERAWLVIEGLIPYQEVAVIDDIGDEHVEDCHLYIAQWSRGFTRMVGRLEPTRSGREPRHVESETDDGRSEKFASALRLKSPRIRPAF